MTNTASSGTIAAEIEALRLDLLNVTAAIPAMGKPAIAMADKLQKAITQAQTQLADALAHDLLEAQKKRLANFSDIRVEWDHSETNLTYMSFMIFYTHLCYDDRFQENLPKQHIANGFPSLPDDVYEYLVTVRPDAIPAPIMALAPNDPHEAFDIYLAGKRRGYFKGRAAA